MLRNLTKSEAFRKFADEELVEDLIELDSECAINIADYYDKLEQVDTNEILNIIVNSIDPTIRYAAVKNYSTPKTILNIFLDDIDIKVS